MNCTVWNEKLHDRLDGTLPSADAPALEAHLAACPACRARLDSLRLLRATAQNLPREISPARDLWPEIAAQLAAPRHDHGHPVGPGRPRAFPRPLLLKFAAAIALVIGGVATWHWRAPATAPAWTVASLAGAPRVNSRSFEGESRLHVGQWLETDPASRAKVSVGAIGEVSIGPNSRVRLVGASATDHRLELARGRLAALIWAPPRLFFVETPAATAIDLGCAYTLDVDDNGDGLLHVTSGYVALQHDGRESIIAAGQMCRTRRGAGPGTPFATDAPAGFRHALERFDFDPAPGALAEILSQARAADAVTLYHLLLRATGPARGEIFATLTRDHPLPAGVTRAGILAGDKAMLAAWSASLGLTGFARP